MALGICTSLFTCGGNNGIAKASAITIACLTEKKKEQNLVKGPLNIMANGPCDAYMAYRFPTLSAKNYSGWIESLYKYHIFSMPLTQSSVDLFRSLFPWPFQLWTLRCISMVGFPFFHLFTISYPWDQIRGHSMSMRAYGISMGFCLWMHGFGVQSSTVGKIFGISSFNLYVVFSLLFIFAQGR